jgi:AcrR family transcriptional regulator
MPPAKSKTRATGGESPHRDRIRHISAELFAAKGYNGVGIAEIGDAVGLGRGALYYHIGSKEDLLYDIASRYIGELVKSGQEIASATSDPIARIRQLSRHLMGTIGRHLSELTVCFREVNALTGDHHRVVSDLHARYQQIWADAVIDGTEKGVFRPIPTVALKGLLGMYFYSFLWLNPQGRYTPEEIADIFSDLVLRAVAEYGTAGAGGTPRMEAK